MKQTLKHLFSFPINAIARACLVFWIFGVADHSCMAADTILPDIPQIDWRDLRQGKLIGKGGFGEVYEGQWKGQDVAIKKLHMHALPNATVKRDFDAEVRVMWSSQYPRILRLYGVTEPGNCAMVMERMQRSLHDLIHSEEEIPDAKRLQIAIDIAQGLASLHGQKIVHRDLKSQNILLDKRDRGKISDFGLAKIRVHTQSTTKSGGMSGTVRWSAPEVFGTEPQTTPASDMYSYGMILWELLTRKTPFEKQPNDIMVLVAVQGGAREIVPEGCPPVWREVIKGCWEETPGKRPTASDILARFMSLRPPHRPIWLPEEDPKSPLRVEGYVRQLASQGDWDMVLRSYTPHPVPGYDVGRVEVIFNPEMNAAFKARCEHLQQRRGNPRFAASWRQSHDGEARAEVARRLEVLTEPWQDDDYPDVKLMPLWHGTQRDKLGSLLSAWYGAFGDTDDGYFGKGIYATFEAAYAQMYADKFGSPDLRNGVLIFNWGLMYNSCPIIQSDYNRYSKRLTWTPDTPRYDSHFVPVVPLTQVDYVPVFPPEPHQFTEVVFFEASQLLPRYLITLQPSLPNSPMTPMSQVSVLLESLKGQRKVPGQADQNMEALSKQLEESKKSVAAKTMELEQYQREARELIQYKREADQQIEALKFQLAAEKEKEEARVKQLAIMEREKLRATEEEKRVAALRPAIPLVAQGHEAIYQRFLNGVLIYRPNGDGNDNGRINLPIRELGNPLEGTFDLSRCGDTGKYLSIATGYRKGKKPENASKVEIWFAPRFLIEKELNGSAAHFKPIMGNWKQEAPVGMFCTWGGWDSLSDYDYLTTESMDNLSKINLYENWTKCEVYGRPLGLSMPMSAFRFFDHRVGLSCSFCELK
jgi:serine/threonine protein kinase